MTGNSLHPRLPEIMAAHPNLYQVGVAYAPYAFDSRRRAYAPSMSREGESVVSFQLGDLSDYTKPGVAWFALAVGPPICHHGRVLLLMCLVR